MKQLLVKLILPLSIISFFTITKWWYTLPEDAPDTLYIGFPFPYLGDGWHTSMSQQIFILELLTDFIFYFLFWFVFLFFFNSYIKKINLTRIISKGLWVISMLLLFFAVLNIFLHENIFYFKRTYSMEIMDSGYKFLWEELERPNYYKYHPNSKDK